MAEFKIDGRMTVRTLKESFKKEFEGTLRVYNGRELADDNATLASIRQDEAKGSELVCRASRTVGKFEKEMREVLGIKVQVASPDDYVLALDGITLANIKNIKKYATKADMEELVAYKRKATIENAVESSDETATVTFPEYLKGALAVDISFKKVDWELNEENIEKHRDDEEGSEYIDFYGVVVVRAIDDEGEFDTKVIADVDICDGLYDALEEVERYFEDGWASVEVFYSTRCEVYGGGKPHKHGQDIGYILSEYMGAEECYYSEYEGGILCRTEWKQEDGDIIDFAYIDEDGCFDLLDIENASFESLTNYLNNSTVGQCGNELDDYDDDDDYENEDAEKVQCLNMNNELLFEPDVYSAEDVTVSPNGMILIESENGMYYVNQKGEQVISDRFDYALSFKSNGLASVQVNDKWGYINEKGDVVISCKFDDAGDFVSNGLAKVQVNDKWGYVNEKGDEVISCKFDWAGDFASNGLAKVQVNDKWGYINEKGDEVISCKFDYAEDFASNGLAKVRVNGKRGYINEKGDEVISCKFDGAGDFASNGLANIQENGKWGYINEKGDEVVPCKFDGARPFKSNDLASVCVNGKWGYINEKGDEVIPCKFDDARPFEANGLASVRVNGKWGYINEKGDEVIPCKFDDARPFESNGFANVEVDGKSGVINTTGEFVIPCEYSELIMFEEEGLVFVKK